MMNYFLSCDWGTSSFRLRLIEADSLLVLAERKSKEGISDTYRSWLSQKDAVARQDFYVRIIRRQIDKLGQDAELQKQNIDLAGIPVILSGMASSTIGLIELPYKAVPFALNSSDLNMQVLNEEAGANPLIVVSGACTENDVIRGEETKVLGCAQYLNDGEEEVLLLMPGTHPKHILIRGQQVYGFKSYMTGEFFDLLSGHGVLSAVVKEGADIDDPESTRHFNEGLKDAGESNLLHASFMVRTRQVLQQIPPEHNYHYLSGLLIGNELKDMNRACSVYLVSTGLHTRLYSKACAALGIHIEQVIDADEALVRGQQIVFSLLEKA